MTDIKIKLGKGNNPLTLDAAKLITRCALIQGGRDSGKSYLARVIVEQTIDAGLQTIILDPEGEFATLRERCDILIAGKNADVPVEVRSAKLLARRIAETGVSTVVDLHGIRPIQDRYVFIRDFLDVFDQLPKSLQNRPRLFVIDEAHLACPESGKGKAVSAESIVVLMSQGRKRGHGTILITQRLSKIRKDASNECGTFFIGNTAPSDLATAQDVLGITRKERDQLRSLPAGTFWAAGSGIGNVTQFEVRKSTTTHPEPGDRYKLEPLPPQKAVARILKEFEALPPDKETEEAASLADANTKIKTLTKEVERLRKTPPPDPGVRSELEAKLAEAREEADTEHHRRWEEQEERDEELRDIMAKIIGLEGVADGMKTKLAALRNMLETLTTGSLRRVDSPTMKRKPTPERPTKARVAPREQRRRPPSSVSTLPFTWSSAPGRLLTVMIQYHPEHMPVRRIAALAGLNAKSSTTRNAMSKLRSVGVIAEDGRSAWATEDAVTEYGGMVEPLPSGEDLIIGWRLKLGGVPLQIFDALLQLGGNASRSEVCMLAGADADKSTSRNAFSKLRKLGLIQEGRGETLTLSEHVLEAMG